MCGLGARGGSALRACSAAARSTGRRRSTRASDWQRGNPVRDTPTKQQQQQQQEQEQEQHEEEEEERWRGGRSSKSRRSRSSRSSSRRCSSRSSSSFRRSSNGGGRRQAAGGKGPAGGESEGMRCLPRGGCQQGASGSSRESSVRGGCCSTCAMSPAAKSASKFRPPLPSPPTPPPPPWLPVPASHGAGAERSSRIRRWGGGPRRIG